MNRYLNDVSTTIKASKPLYHTKRLVEADLKVLKAINKQYV